MQRVKYDNSFKSYVISLYQAGKSQSDISKSLKINKSMVSRWIHKFNTTGNVTTLRSGGPPRKLSYRDDIQMKKMIKKYPFISSKEILKTLNLNVDSSTIRRHAIKLGLKSYKACSKPMLTKKHMKKRLEFAKKYIDWSVEKWNTVLFSDEVKVNLFNSDGMCTVRHQKGNRLNPRYCKQTVKHGGGNVMMWTCLSGNRLDPVHQIVDKMDQFLCIGTF